VAIFLKSLFHNFELKFDSGNFFLFILPPIIFAAGFNLEKKNFIRNIETIFALGIGATILSMIFIALIV
jgi:sodium/hydrogen exchanger-like protein 6/7